MKILKNLILTLTISVIVPLFAATNAVGKYSDDASIGRNNISVNFDVDNSRLSLRMQTKGDAGNILILISDASGNIVHRETTLVDGPSKIDISLDDLLRGDYFVRVKGSSVSYSGRFNKN